VIFGNGAPPPRSKRRLSARADRAYSLRHSLYKHHSIIIIIITRKGPRPHRSRQSRAKEDDKRHSTAASPRCQTLFSPTDRQPLFSPTDRQAWGVIPVIVFRVVDEVEVRDDYYDHSFEVRVAVARRKLRRSGLCKVMDKPLFYLREAALSF
jgi:hypothetical protein